MLRNIRIIIGRGESLLAMRAELYQQDMPDEDAIKLLQKVAVLLAGLDGYVAWDYTKNS